MGSLRDRRGRVEGLGSPWASVGLQGHAERTLGEVVGFVLDQVADRMSFDPPPTANQTRNENPDALWDVRRWITELVAPMLRN